MYEPEASSLSGKLKFEILAILGHSLHSENQQNDPCMQRLCKPVEHCSDESANQSLHTCGLC